MGKKGARPNANIAQIAKAHADGVDMAMILCMTVLYDKFGFDNDMMADYWRHCQKLSVEIRENRINIYDLRKVLRGEYGVLQDGR